MDGAWSAPSARVGMIGAGQLARMTHQAAIALAVELRVLAEDPEAPAVQAGAVPVLGGADDPAALARLAKGCDVVTFDHEHVHPSLMRDLARRVVVRPSPEAKRMGQDKLHARRALAEARFPVPAFAPVADVAGVAAFASQHGWPVVLKAASGGYDGKGVWFVADAAAAAQVCDAAARAGTDLLAEAHVPILRELSVLVARSPSGATATYPVLETRQRDGTCVEVEAPARIPPTQAAEAARLAVAAADGLGATGLVAVELFVTAHGLVVNELALRPHNSGHLTIEACVTSQFEQHLRAVLDWPLGDTALMAPAAAMVNVLGPADGSDPRTRLPRALAVAGARVHLYGKVPAPGRKLGHVTALGDTPRAALATARAAAGELAGEHGAGS